MALPQLWYLVQLGHARCTYMGRSSSSPRRCRGSRYISVNLRLQTERATPIRASIFLGRRIMLVQLEVC
uniref:Uncharacterized protein n=1 Tax=Oryza brachyantha TaxID=4533 RepID=J3MGN6_ORYBR